VPAVRPYWTAPPLVPRLDGLARFVVDQRLHQVSPGFLPDLDGIVVWRARGLSPDQQENRQSTPPAITNMRKARTS
jgi:hypothetical protein